MVSYSRARAENVMPSCKVGFLERPERIVLIIIGALANRMAPVLWVLAVLSNITVIHRIIYTWTGTREIDKAEKAAAEQGEEGATSGDLSEGYGSSAV